MATLINVNKSFIYFRFIIFKRLKFSKGSLISKLKISRILKLYKISLKEISIKTFLKLFNNFYKYNNIMIYLYSYKI